MSYQSRYARRRDDQLVTIASTVLITSIIIAMLMVVAWMAHKAMSERPQLVVVMGAEDDCPYKYGGVPLIDVVGIEIDGQHKVECRY